MKDCEGRYMERIVVVECDDGRHSSVSWSKNRKPVGGEENGAGRSACGQKTATN
jgi:hypothetical protein